MRAKISYQDGGGCRYCGGDVYSADPWLADPDEWLDTVAVYMGAGEEG